MPHPPSDEPNRATGQARELSLARFWGPRYWPTWVLLGLMHVAARLPPSGQQRLGRALGGLLRRVKRREHRVEMREAELEVARGDAVLAAFDAA
jgi:lauroyl/myristoyl acyltransferase